MSKLLSLTLSFVVACNCCTDFSMNFSSYCLSGRTLDLGNSLNWTISTWPASAQNQNSKYSSDLDISERTASLVTWSAKYGSIGLTSNWFGDDAWLAIAFFGDTLNEKGLSCGTLALVGTKYQEKSLVKDNVFAGLFCHYAAQNFESVLDLQRVLPTVAIYGPDALAQHFIVRDAAGLSLIIEVMDGRQHVYLDKNDGTQGFGIMTNEPTYNWHVQNVQHYEWKRDLERQAVAVPGNFYPEERFLRTHMIKAGMQQAGLMDKVTDFKQAFALTVQVLNSVSVPEGDQYGTDTGMSSGEGESGDHTKWAVVRDHLQPAIYWRDSGNPTFRSIRLSDVDLSAGAKQLFLPLESGPLFVDMSSSLSTY